MIDYDQLTTLRLSNLTKLAIDQEMIDKIDIDSVIEHFASRKVRKVPL